MKPISYHRYRFPAAVIAQQGTIWLYYSRNDRELNRATIRRLG